MGVLGLKGVGRPILFDQGEALTCFTRLLRVLLRELPPWRKVPGWPLQRLHSLNHVV